MLFGKSKLILFLWILRFLTTLKSTSCSTNQNYNEDIQKKRQERAILPPPVNKYKVYAALKAVPTLASHIKNFSVTSFNLIGWTLMSALWTLYKALTGLSANEESILTYDFIGRITNHFTDPQQAATRMAINFGGQIFNSILLLWLATLPNPLETSDKTSRSDDGFSFPNPRETPLSDDVSLSDDVFSFTNSLEAPLFDDNSRSDDEFSFPNPQETSRSDDGFSFPNSSLLDDGFSFPKSLETPDAEFFFSNPLETSVSDDTSRTYDKLFFLNRLETPLSDDTSRSDDGFSLVKLEEDRQSKSLFSSKKDTLDNCDDGDATCQVLNYIYSMFDRTYRYSTTIIFICNTLIANVGRLIFWTVIGSMPDPDVIVEGFEL